MLYFIQVFTMTLFVLSTFGDSFQDPGSSDACLKAFEECGFRFEHSTTLVTLVLDWPNDVPFSQQIVSKTDGERIGILNSNGVEPEFMSTTGDARPMSSFDNRITPTQFKPYPLPFRMGSGVGHELFQVEAELFRNRCIRVHFTSFQRLIRASPPQVKNRNLTPAQAVRRRKCVVFRSSAVGPS